MRVASMPLHIKPIGVSVFLRKTEKCFGAKYFRQEELKNSQMWA